MVNQDIKIVIFSNMKASERYTPLIDAVRDATNYKVKIITIRGEGALKKIKRIFQTGSRGFYTGVSNAYDFMWRRKVLRDKDFETAES